MKLLSLVIVNDYSRFTWTLFLAAKNDTFHAFKKLANVLENEKSSKIVCFRSDYGGEFRNGKFEHICEKHGIKHNFSVPTTPQQNEVFERKNISIKELVSTTLNGTSSPKYFWVDVVNTTNYVLNHALIKPILKKTP